MSELTFLRSQSTNDAEHGKPIYDKMFRRLCCIIEQAFLADATREIKVDFQFNKENEIIGLRRFVENSS